MRLWCMLAVVALVGWSAGAWAQGPGSSSSQQPAAVPAMAQKFPFPGEDTPALPKANVPDAPAAQTKGPDAPAAPSVPAGQRFPFPGEDGQAAHKADAPDAPKAGANTTPAGKRFPFPGEDSSSSSSNAGGEDAPAMPDTSGAAPKPAAKGPGKPIAVKAQSVDDRVTEDIQIARFYRNDGNYKGAYLRAKDALDHMPDDAEVNFVYAQATEKMGNKQEALEHYQAYLKMEPKGPYVKAAQQAVEELSK